MRRVLTLIAALTVLALPLTVPATGGSVSIADARSFVRGLPDGVAPAALRPEATLPTPRGWPFPESFPRTFGFGRLDAGALFWTDFIYDDYGARGSPNSNRSAALAPTAGQYSYPAGAASNNGADIFRIGIGLDRANTYWRVDWNTLVDPAVPIAAFGLDTDSSAATGTASWPASAGVSSPGLDSTLVVSGTGAWLIDAAGSKTPVEQLGGAHTVDKAARSFVVRLPRKALAPKGTWTVRLVAGLADASGDGFAPASGARPDGARVYNVGFRSNDQEKGGGDSFWFEGAQAQALLVGDVSSFSTAVDWRALARRASTREPRPAGYSNRWYVSSIERGAGWLGGANVGLDGLPNFLGRVQPYEIYVPAAYDGSAPAPLTWILHSLGENHNQYMKASPNFVQAACENRNSICVTTFGRGPDGWYIDDAELDFWEVWRDVATHFRLDPERTVLSGYSMGGYGTWKLGTSYPQVFAGAFALAGPPTCGIEVTRGVDFSSGGPCKDVGPTAPMLPNIRWLPYLIAHGGLDELVPVLGVIERAQDVDKLGYRYRFELYPLQMHTAWGAEDMAHASFTSVAAHMALVTPRVRNPGHVTFVADSVLMRPDLGIGPTGAYWLSGIRVGAGGRFGRVDAVSRAVPDPSVTLVRNRSVMPSLEPSPAIVTELSWKIGDRPAPAPRLDVTLENVAGVAIDVARAGLVRTGGVVAVQTDGASMVSLAGLPRGTRVTVDGKSTAVAAGVGRLAAALTPGKHMLRVDPAAGAIEPRVLDRSFTRLPATGVGRETLVLGLVALALATALQLVAARGRR